MEIVFQLDQWAKINNDLLDEIIQHIDCYGDYIRFRSVCKNWHLKLPKFPRHIKLPLLLLPFDNESDTLRPFYHIEERKVIYDIELLETKNTMFRGSCYGWLIMVGLYGEVQMLEPFTRVHIDLPPLSTFPDIVDYQCNRVDEEYTRRCKHGIAYNSSNFHMQKAYIDRIVISSPPDDDNQDFMAIAIYGEFSKLCYCRRGDKMWSDFPTQDSIYCDVIFHGGKIYAINYKGYVYEYDMKTMVKNIRIIPEHICYDDYRRYLVGIDGNLLLVTRHLNDWDRGGNDRVYRTTKFHVYKLFESEEDEEARWIEIKSLGDYVLVLGFNSSVSLLPLPVSHNRRNCIYYSDDHVEFQYMQIEGGHDNGVFDLENQTIHHFFPNSSLICPPPIWLLPV